MTGRFWRSVFIPGVALILIVLCEEGSSIAVPGGDRLLPQTVIINRKLKEKHDEIEEDYPELDPAPSTKSAIKSAPIVHDTFVMTSIPRSTPPVIP